MMVEQYIRKSFPVDAIRISEDNFADVAKWCDGEIHEDGSPDNPTSHPFYIKVRVHNPLNERQTKGYVGDWVLYAGKGYKVYTDKAFRKSFEGKAVEQNVFAGVPEGQTALFGSNGTAGVNPGGTTSVG